MAKLARTLLAAAAALAWGFAAAAQEGVDTPRARQQALHDEMVRAPDDPELMLAYARASAEARDYEAVIATLERALIYQPGDAAIMLELGSAYFRLGSYAAARQYFESARAAGVSPEAEATLDSYIAAIDDRTERSRFTGMVTAGFAASTNANLGVDDREISFFGVPALIGPEFEAKGGGGFRTTGVLTHSYDLGRPTLDFWRTDAAFYALDFFNEDQGDVATLSFVTGPSLSLDESAFGTKARPFVGARVVRAEGEPYYVEYGGGGTITTSIGADWGFFGRLDAGVRDYASAFDDYDAAVFQGVAGTSYTVAPGRTLFAALLAETDRADEAFNTNVEAGVRLAASFDYDPGLSFAREPSTFFAYGQASVTNFDQPNPTVDPDTDRRDVDLVAGVSNLLRIRDGFGVQLEVDAVRRTSNIDNYEVESLTGVLSIVYEF